MESHWSNRGFTSQWDILNKKNALLRRDVHDQQRKSGEEPTSLSFPDRRREHAGGPQRRRVTPRRRRGGHECRAGSRAFWPSLFVVAEVVAEASRRRLPRPRVSCAGGRRDALGQQRPWRSSSRPVATSVARTKLRRPARPTKPARGVHKWCQPSSAGSVPKSHSHSPRSAGTHSITRSTTRGRRLSLEPSSAVVGAVYRLPRAEPAFLY